MWDRTGGSNTDKTCSKLVDQDLDLVDLISEILFKNE